jgi:hypothetical protein
MASPLHATIKRCGGLDRLPPSEQRRRRCEQRRKHTIHPDLPSARGTNGNLAAKGVYANAAAGSTMASAMPATSDQVGLTSSRSHQSARARLHHVPARITSKRKRSIVQVVVSFARWPPAARGSEQSSRPQRKVIERARED